MGLAAVATLAMAGAARLAATALVPEPVRVIAFSGVSTLPILAGQARGVFARRGLAVEVETYARAAAPRGGLARDARLDVDGLRKVLKLRAALEGQEDGTPPPPERYYDPAYHDAALALVAAGAAAPAVKPDGSMR